MANPLALFRDGQSFRLGARFRSTSSSRERSPRWWAARWRSSNPMRLSGRHPMACP